ncbi:MAG TPA: patatin-like phospholipase family protein, partial [Solirubrobacteraceae bacterium]|nr:patatin-like phospholipase family protein [Solirubrobacteraceae bacterium]
MGQVVKLEPAAEPRPRRRRVPAAPRARPSKTALVLGGGGLTGGVYEIGALQAIDLLSVNTTINDFDVYVGTSAGAFIAALAANGVTPDEMMRAALGQGPTKLGGMDIGTLLRLDVLEYARKGVLLPFRAALLARELAGKLAQVSMMDVVLGLAEALPSGFYTGGGMEGYLRQVLADPERTDDFRELARELYIVATDLDQCERVVFGGAGWDDVPISRAVRASAALPVVYSPVTVKGRELVDGGIVSTTNLDIAVERGAKLVVVINPLVPFVNDFSRSVSTVRGSRPRRVSDAGFPQIGYQAFKMLAHQRLHEMARRWEERYPGVDIVLIEPEQNDELMFETSIMNFTSRVEIARHGFQSVTYRLAGEYESLKKICARHGIEISATRVRKVVAHFDAEPHRTRAWR